MKRIFDIVFSLSLLFILSPVIIIIALLVKIKLGDPILFEQMRPGFDEKIFSVKKFRTMTNATDTTGLLPDKDRITPFGQFLRSTSFDELPQLLNVLRGEMSIVGPRPLLIEYLPFYDPEQKRRHSVKPGITGWAQINGRNNLSWDEKFKCDVWYVDNQSFFLDVKIVLLTFLVVLKRSGISSNNHISMPFFTGTNQEN